MGQCSLKYVTLATDRHGKVRYRFRRKGVDAYITAEPGTAAFADQYQALLNSQPIGRSRVTPGTVNDLIARYYQSSLWTGISPQTKKNRRSILERFRDQCGHFRVASLQFEQADRLLAKKAATHPAAARELQKQLKRLFDYAVKIRMRSDNPFTHTTPIKVETDGHAPWTEDQVRHFQESYPLGTTARLAMELYLWTGNRKADALKLGRQHIRDGAFRLRQGKTKKEMVIPIAPPLAEAIMAMPKTGHMTLLVNDLGRPFTPAGFGNRMRKWLDAIGLQGISTHGLRKTISNRMALSGAGNQGIKSITGHSGDSEVALYTRGVEQEAMARATMKRLIEWELSNRLPSDCPTSTNIP